MSAVQPLGSGKAPDAFRTISEVAEDLDIPQHVLRFWETRFTSIRPLKRGGGRRYYRPDDVELLRGIRQLLYGQGFTIKGVQRILKEEGARVVQDVGRGGTLALRRPDAVTDVDPLGKEIEDRLPMEIPAWTSDAARSAPTSDESPVALARSRLAETDVGRLREALADLLECQRALEALRRR